MAVQQQEGPHTCTDGRKPLGAGYLDRCGGVAHAAVRAGTQLAPVVLAPKKAGGGRQLWLGAVHQPEVQQLFHCLWHRAVCGNLVQVYYMHSAGSLPYTVTPSRHAHPPAIDGVGAAHFVGTSKHGSCSAGGLGCAVRSATLCQRWAVC